MRDVDASAGLDRLLDVHTRERPGIDLGVFREVAEERRQFGVIVHQLIRSLRVLLRLDVLEDREVGILERLLNLSGQCLVHLSPFGFTSGSDQLERPFAVRLHEHPGVLKSIEVRDAAFELDHEAAAERLVEVELRVFLHVREDPEEHAADPVRHPVESRLHEC